MKKTYKKNGCIRFIDCYRFLSSSLDSLVETLVEDDLEILKNEFPDEWIYLIRILAYPYEKFNSINDHQTRLKIRKKNISSKNEKTKILAMKKTKDQKKILFN